MSDGRAVATPSGGPASVRTSVALCTYNGARYLERQLDTLLSQTLPPDEIVVRDDQSTDETRELLACYDAAHPGRFRIKVNAERLGSSANFVAAVADCRGQYVALCDQDDEWHEQKLERSVALLEQAPSVRAVFSDGAVIDASGAPTGETLWGNVRFDGSARGAALLQHLLRRNCVTGCTLVVRRGALADLLPVGRGWIHDYWMAIQLAADDGLRAIPEPLIRYRQHGGNQVGAARADPRERVRRAFERTAAVYAGEAEAWAALSAHMAARGAPAAAQGAVAGRARFYADRVALLGRSRVRRVASVLAIARRRGYSRFADGWKAAVRDLVVARSGAGP